MRRSLSRAICLLAAAVLPAAGCSGPEPSPAADAFIAQAADEEEREGLMLARDDLDAEMREKADALDAEIERLRKEQAALKARLEARRSRR